MQTILKTYLILFFAVAISSCTEDDGGPLTTESDVQVNFETVQHSVSKSGDPLVVKLTLAKAAPVDGSVAVHLSGDAVSGENFTTTPEAEDGVITLDISEGQSSISFTITPLSEEEPFIDHTIELTLEDPSTGFELGDKVTASVTLLGAEQEQEAPAISFQEQQYELSETDGEGYKVLLQLTGEVDHLETFTVQVSATSGFVYGTNYATNVNMLPDYFTLHVYPGVEEISFTAYPIDDKALKGDYEVTFTIGSTSEGLSKGAQDIFSLSITEDDIIDPSEINTIADLRDKFETYEGDWYLSTDYYIEGVVTSKSNVLNEKTVYIQDATGGIMLSFYAERLVDIGDKVQLNLKNGTGELIDGQKAIIGVEDRLGILIAENLSVTPETISVQQLASGNYQGRRVKVENVTLSAADGVRTWLGSHQISDATYAWAVTTLPTADFKDNLLPSGTVTITGIVGAWGNLQPQDYQEDIVVQQ